ncbi:MAG: hypothetical protein FJ386_09080 [Verrucomicrobia bacterium]|nr:hypothetical protein [Verrucomicrobiota bacterium]
MRNSPIRPESRRTGFFPSVRCPGQGDWSGLEHCDPMRQLLRSGMWLCASALLIQGISCQRTPPGIAPLLAQLESAVPAEREKGVDSLRKAGTNCLPDLVLALRGSGIGARKQPTQTELDNPASTNPGMALVSQRRRAILAFKLLGPIATPVVPQLKEMLGEKETSIHAANALAAIGPEGIAILLAQSTNPDRRVHANVMQTLGNLGPEAQSCLPMLVSGLQHTQPSIRSASAVVLGRLGNPPVKEATDALVKSLGETDGAVRERILMAIGNHGAAAKAAAPGLAALLKDADTNTVNLAAHVLWKIDPEAARRAGAVDRIQVTIGKEEPPKR